MNEEALNRLFILAENDGYKKSFEEFKVLMSSNEDAINTMYGLAKGDGYRKDINEFKTLVGFDQSVKKKDETLPQPGQPSEVIGQPSTGTPTMESGLTLQSPTSTELVSPLDGSTLASEEEQTRKQSSDYQSMISMAAGQIEEDDDKYKVKAIGKKAAAPRPNVSLEEYADVSVKLPVYKYKEGEYDPNKVFKPEQSYTQGVISAADKLGMTPEDYLDVDKRLKRQEEIRADEKAIEDINREKKNLEIENAYVKNISKTYGINEDEVKNNLPFFALKNTFSDPEGRYLMLDSVDGVESFDPDDVLNLRQQLAEKAINTSGIDLKQKAFEKIINKNDGDVVSSEKVFDQGMEDVGYMFLNDEEKEIKKLKESILILESNPNITPEEKRKLETKKEELTKFMREGLLGYTQLFDPSTGKFVSSDEASEEVISFNNKVNNKIKSYENTDLGKLKKYRDDVYFSYQAFVLDFMLDQKPTGLSPLAIEAFANRYGIDTYDERTGKYKSTTELLNMFTKEQKKEMALEEYKDPFNFHGWDLGGTGDMSQAFKIMNSDIFPDDVTEKAIEILADYMSANRMINLNEDPGSVQESYGLGRFLTYAGKALKESVGVVPENVEFVADRAIENIKKAGFDLTLQQQDAIKQDMTQKAGEAIGGSLVPMAEIMVNLALVNKAAAVAKIPALIKTISGGNKIAEFGLGLTYEMASQGAAFEMAGQEFVGGAGEGFGQFLVDAALKKLNIDNRVLSVISKSVGGALSETAAEYTGQFVDELSKKNIGFDKAVERTFGKTPEDAMEKFALTYLVSQIYGLGTSTVSTLTNPLTYKKSDYEQEISNEQWSDWASKQVIGFDSDSPIVNEIKKFAEEQQAQSSPVQKTEIESILDFEEKKLSPEDKIETPEATVKRAERISELNSLLASDAASLQETGTGNLLPEAKQEVQQELETLKSEQNAIQEQTAGQVSVQPETAVSETVEEGTPTTEPEVVTEKEVGTVDDQGRSSKPGDRLFNDPNPETSEISSKYKQSKGISTSPGENITELDIDNSMRLADAYEEMQDNPSDPEVQEAYNALAKETVDQYKAMTEAGYEIEIYEGDGEPYANSQEMIDDLKNNKHMYIFSTESGFGEQGITDTQRKENSMLQDSGFKDKNGKPLLINDLFRGVHDFFGHSERGNGFGAKGEENAWDVHARMFTDKARRAMTTETRGQNSWVNFGPQMRNESGQIIKKGEPGYLSATERAFAPQKMGLLPLEFSNIIDDKIEVETKPELTEGANKLLDALKPKVDKPNVRKQVDNAKKAIANVSPETKIIVHETSQDYTSSKKGRKQNEGGEYDIDNDTIHINLEAANERTVAHEVFHAILLNKGMSDKQAQSITSKMLDAVKKSASPELTKRLDDFSSKYDEPLQSEESIAELFGILASEYETLPRPTQNLVKRWLDKLAKLFGLKPFTDSEIIDMMNVVSKKIEEGVEIKEKEIKPIRKVDIEKEFEGGIPVDELTDADMNQDQTSQWEGGKSIEGLQGKDPKEVVSRVRNQKGLINVSEQEVLKYSRAGIENQYDAQAIKQIGLQGVKFDKASIQEKIKEEFDALIDKADTYVMSEDSKAVDSAIQFEIDTLENEGASLQQIENAKRAFEPGSMRDAFIDKYKSTQRETIDQWKSYLSESDYNDAFKYLILDAILTNNYDFKTDKYTKRASNTIRNFTPFDAGTLAALYASDSKKLLKDYVEIQAQNTNNIVESSSYVSTSEGEWVKFEGGTSVSNEVRTANANKLSQMVQNTYWCTKTNAKSQLDGGDFYVYATKNKDGEYEPRVAVRMQGNEVGEVRGNASSKQDLEPDMLPVADKFLKENIPNNSGKKWLDSIEYNTKVKDLTDKIDGKVIDEQSLQEYFEIIKDANKFKVDYGENGLVTKLKNVFKDAKFDFPIARNLRELRPNTVLFIGNFKPLEEVQSNLFPKYVEGYANFENSQVTDLGRLQSIGGYAYFGDSQVTDLGSLQSIGGYASFENSQVTDLGSLQSIGGDANFEDSQVTELGGLQSIGGDASFGDSQVTELGGLQSIGGDASFGDSQVTELGRLQSIGGGANFRDSQVTDLGSLQSIGGDANFEDSQVTDLGSLQSIGGHASFGYSQVTELGGLQSIGGNANFGYSQVTELGGLQSIGGGANFGDSQVTDLGSLQSIGRYAYFGDKQNLKEEFNRRQSEQTRVRKQVPEGTPSIAGVRAKAKELNISESDTISALKQLGYSDAEISTEAKSRMDKAINDAKDKYELSVKKRGNKHKDGVESALNDLKKSDWYNESTDTKRDEAVREIEEFFGEKIKKAPSADKVLGNKKNKVTVDEMAALKSQIRLEAGSSRKSIKAYKDAAKSIIEAVKQLEKKGLITLNQSTVIIKKVLSTNMLNENMVDKLTDYIEKVYKKADISDKILTINKLRKRAIKNLKSKVGPFKELQQVLKDLFSIDGTSIPINKIDSYIEILEQFGGSSTVLNLSESGGVLSSAYDILKSIEKVDDVDIESVSLTNELNETIEEDFEGYIKEIISNKIDLENVQKGDAKKLAEFLNSLTKSDLEALVKEKKDGTKDYSMLEKLKELKSNMTNGYVNKLANTIRNTVEINRGKDLVRDVIKKVTKISLSVAFSRAYGKIKGVFTNKSGLTESIRGTNSKFIDDILGNYNSSTIYDNTIGRLAKAWGQYTSDLSINVQSKLDAAENLLYKTKIPTIQKLTRDVQLSKFKIQAYRLQREFQSNLDNKSVASAIDFINETIIAIKKNKAGENSEVVMKRDIGILEQIKKEFTVDGEISMEGIYNSFSKNEKKALELIDEAGDIESKYLWVATVIRGAGVKPINNYIHHNVLDITDNKKITDINGAINTSSIEAGTVRERTPGAKAINFDPISSTLSGAKDILLDYHMTNALNVANGIISSVKKTEGLTPIQQEAINAVENVKNELIENALINSFSSLSTGDKIISFAVKTGYAAALASIPRAGAELGSNLTYAFTQPQAFLGGVKNFGGFTMNTVEAMNAMVALNSSETKRLYNADAMVSAMTDSSLLASRPKKSKKVPSALLDQAAYIAQFTGLKQLKSLTGTVADKLLSTPDKIVSRPFWFGAFALQFKKETGISLTKDDMSEISNGTSKYLGSEYDSARNEAVKYADSEMTKMATSNNPFNSTLKNIVKPSDKFYTQLYKTANGYMASFMMNEYNTTRNSILSLLKSGKITKGQATATIIGIQTRVLSYMILYKLLSSMFYSLFGAEDEDHEDLEGYALRQMVGGPISMITGRGLGQMPRVLISLGTEKFNEKYLQDLRDGREYDSFKHSIVFSLLSPYDIEKKSPEENFIKTIAGPYSPAFSTLSNLVTDFKRIETSDKPETVEKYKKDLQEVASVKVLGNLSLLPFYKDIITIIKKNKYKGYDKDKSNKDKKRIVF